MKSTIYKAAAILKGCGRLFHAVKMVADYSSWLKKSSLIALKSQSMSIFITITENL